MADEEKKESVQEEAQKKRLKSWKETPHDHHYITLDEDGNDPLVEALKDRGHKTLP